MPSITANLVALLFLRITKILLPRSALSVSSHAGSSGRQYDVHSLVVGKSPGVSSFSNHLLRREPRFVSSTGRSRELGAGSASSLGVRASVGGNSGGEQERRQASEDNDDRSPISHHRIVLHEGECEEDAQQVHTEHRERGLAEHH